MRFRRPTALLAAMVLAGCAIAETPRAPGPGSADWTARTALYEVFVRNFSPQGTFRGVADGLDRIEAVGAEVLWLMPIHPIGEIERKGPLGSPYSTTDYRALNPDFGTEADFRALVRAVQGRGMKLILDWVPNHTAWDHVWVTRHPEFYARDERGEMTVPRDLDGNLTDWTDVVELDYGNPAMRQAMIAAMLYWLTEFGVDGFRVDVACYVPADFWREAIPQLRHGRSILLLAECDEPRMHELGFDLTYDWDSYHRLKAVWRGERAASFVERVLEDLRTMPAGGYRIRFTTNHDETSWDAPPPTLFGSSAGARAAFVAMALLPGPPLLYNGQEIESPQRQNLFVRDPIEWDEHGGDEARAFYRRVVELARGHEAFAAGDLEVVHTDAPDAVIAYRRGDVLVLVNARQQPVHVAVTDFDLAGARDLLQGATLAEAGVLLPPYGVVVAEVAP
jgi:glycosidase